ncbi:hypothetical protein GCM10012279_34610 [Micromonospora yangpuensis]|nr:hypothetical protein GCM10012279_34610 [Micromonospora yangpuensis]
MITMNSAHAAISNTTPARTRNRRQPNRRRGIDPASPGGVPGDQPDGGPPPGGADCGPDQPGGADCGPDKPGGADWGAADHPGGVDEGGVTAMRSG